MSRGNVTVVGHEHTVHAVGAVLLGSHLNVSSDSFVGVGQHIRSDDSTATSVVALGLCGAATDVGATSSGLVLPCLPGVGAWRPGWGIRDAIAQRRAYASASIDKQCDAKRAECSPSQAAA